MGSLAQQQYDCFQFVSLESGCKMFSVDVAVDLFLPLNVCFVSCVWQQDPKSIRGGAWIWRYLEVAPIKAHPVDLAPTWPRRVHPVDEFLLIVKVYVDDVVEALSGETIQLQLQQR